MNRYFNDANTYLVNLDNVNKKLYQIKEQITFLRDLFSQAEDLTYFTNVGVFDKDTYGQDILDTVQSYVQKVIGINLSNNYETEKDNIQKAIITSLDTSSLILDYLNSKGQTKVEETINSINAIIKYYNDELKVLTAHEGGITFNLKSTYNNFINYKNRIQTFSDNQYLKSLSTLKFEDKENENVNFLLKQIKNNYDIISSYNSNYLKLVQDSLDTTLTLEYYIKVNNSLFDCLNTYGNYDEENDCYIIKEDIVTKLSEYGQNYQIKVTAYEYEVAARDAIFSAGAASIVHVKPIVMTLNRYGNSYINGWDGNKLYIDEENGQYLFAPQVGAGYKDEGQFTGMLMGVRGSNGVDEDTDVGLFGYYKGEQSIFLDSKKGSATFGVSGGGQIIIDPSELDKDGKPKASLKSGNYKPSTYDDYGKLVEKGEGMEINLATPSIQYGNENFSVDRDGNMIAQTGWIGGWEIGVSGSGRLKESSVLHSPSIKSDDALDKAEINDMLYLDSNAKKDENGNFVKASTLQNAAIYTGGHTNLKNTSKGFFLDAEGLSVNSYFRIDEEGVKVGDLSQDGKNNYWIIKGKPADGEENISYSYIAYGTEEFEGENAQIYDSDKGYYTDPTTTVYLGTNGICLGNKFWVNPEGFLYSEKGRIANWLIVKNRLLGNNNHMDFNSRDGYLSYTNKTLEHTEYGSAETRDDVFSLNKGKGFFLGTTGLYFGKWNTYMDAEDGYLHATYGDLGGFHFTGNEMETGLVPKTGYTDGYTGKTYESAKEVLKKARGTTQLIDNEGNTILPEDTSNINFEYNPYNTNEKFSKYMKLSAKDSCLMFNTFGFTDLYDYFKNEKVHVEVNPEGISFAPEEEITEKACNKTGVYIGEKGLNIGANFSVDNRGNLYARNGLIGGWLIKERSISSPIVDGSDKDSEGNTQTYYYKTVFKPEGTLQGGRLKLDTEGNATTSWDNSKMWKLNKNGEAWFTKIKITGGTLNVNNAFIVNEDGSFRAGNGFRVDTDGVVYCTDAVIGGFRFGNGWTRTNSSGRGIYTNSSGLSSLGGWTLTDEALYDTDGGGNNTYFGVNGDFKLQGEGASMKIINGFTTVSIDTNGILMNSNLSFKLTGSGGYISMGVDGQGGGSLVLNGTHDASLKGGGSAYVSVTSDSINLNGDVRIKGIELDSYLEDKIKAIFENHKHSYIDYYDENHYITRITAGPRQ